MDTQKQHIERMLTHLQRKPEPLTPEQLAQMALQREQYWLKLAARKLEDYVRV